MLVIKYLIYRSEDTARKIEEENKKRPLLRGADE